MQNRTSSVETQLEFRLIGAFSVKDAQGNGLALHGRKDRAVLAFLAAHGGRPIARERLVELIWPQAAEGAGRASLRQSISTIRKTLSQFDVFSVDRDTITFNSESTVTDVERLEKCTPGELPSGNIPLVNGETFLDDLSGISAEFDTWRATEQSRLESLVYDLIDKLVQRAEASNDTKKAIAALSQLVSLNPLNEAAQRRYMRALIALGQANSAIRHYRRMESLLLKELGVQPELATRAILTEAKARTSEGVETKSGSSKLQDRTAFIESGGLPKIIVHRFRDLSDDGDNNYFAEGLSDSITAALSHISGLTVILRPRSDEGTVTHQTARDDEPEAFALYGSVRKIGNRVRVSARLVGDVSGRVYWADDYERELEDIFDVQDDVALQITIEMRVKLSEGEKIRVLAKFTKNIEVWARLMRADVLINTLVEEDNIEARRLLEEAVRIDPRCAAAWGELADTYIGDYMMGRRLLPKTEILDQAILAAQKALQVEPSFTHALNIISLVQAFRGDFVDACETAHQALSAEPRNPEIAANCAYALALCGQVDDAQETIRHAIEATPIPPMWYVTVEGLCHYLQGQYDAAIERLEYAVRLVPDSAFPRPYLVGALMEVGAGDEAKKVASEIQRVQPDFGLSTWPGADFADVVLSKRLTDSLVKAGVKH